MRLWSSGGLVATAIVLAGCASIEEIPTEEYATPPPSKMATVYVFRSQSMPTRANLRIDIDGRPVALLPDNHFTWVRVHAGKRLFTTDYGALVDMSAKLEVELAESAVYLLRYEGGTRGTDVPLFGTGGRFIGTVEVGERSRPRLHQVPVSDLESVTKTLPYVPARP
jgi:hypothetical protein